MNGGRQGAMAEVLKEMERKNYGQNCECRAYVLMAAIAQLAARRSHNPKVVSSILTRRNCLHWRSIALNRASS